MTETPADPTENQRPKRGKRWPLGALTLLVVVFVALGVVLLSDSDDTSTTSIPELGGSFDTPAGDAAPDFSIELLDGTQFRLTDHLETDGRPVVLNLWASWCGPCRAEMPALDAAAAAHPEVLFLGVAVEDDPVAAANFAEEIGVSYPLAIDDADRVGRRYPSPGLPATFLITSDRSLLRTIFGQVTESQLDELIAELLAASG